MSYYLIKITGKDVKGFIRYLYKMHINLFDIRYVDNSVIIKVNRLDYLKIKKIKTIYDIRIIKYYGISRVEEFINKYKVFLTILLGGIILLIFLTNIIFDVEILDSNKELTDRLLDTLKEKGISKYKLSTPYNKKEKIKKEILELYNDEIEWLEINRIGTKYVIELEERKILNKKDDNTPRNIIAKKNGIITKITSTNGEIVGKVDSYVKKGDILISGVIHKNEEVVDNIKAEGRVFAEVWYTVTVELPYHYKEEYKTGKNNKHLVMNFLNKNYNLFRFDKYRNSSINNIFSIKNNLLPISLSLVKEEELIVSEELLTQDKILNKAYDIGSKRLKEKLGEDILIKDEKKLKLEEKNSKIKVVIFYKVIEDITSYENIINDLNNQEIR